MINVSCFFKMRKINQKLNNNFVAWIIQIIKSKFSLAQTIEQS